MSFTDVVDSFVGAAASDLVAILPMQRNIGGFIADVTVEERHTDRLEITKHPVEQGAAVTDHSYKQPAQVTILAGWSNSSPEALGNPGYVIGLYNSFLALQASRQLITVVTGKRLYQSMLIASLLLTTDQEHENAMLLTVECQELIIATTQTVSVPSSGNMQNPQINGATQNAGTQSAIPNPPSYNSSASVAGSSLTLSTIPGS